MKPFLPTVVTEKSFQPGANIAELCADAAGELELQEGVRRLLQLPAITIPPRLFLPRQAVDIDVFRLRHFQNSRAAVRAAPAARATSAMRSLGNRKAADGVIDHDCACRSEEHTSELQSRSDLVCRLLLEKKRI